MGHKSRLLIGGLGAAVAALSFVVGLEVQFAMARPGFEPTGINRSLKGDRHPVTPGPWRESGLPPIAGRLRGEFH
jgi:hypothetical protein